MANEKRLIDANALKKAFRTNNGADTLGHSIVKLLKVDKIIDEQPAVDAVEVVHGHWEQSPHLWGFVRCSVCHDCNVWDEWRDGNRWRYCPQCGAKLDGGNDNGKE